MFWRVRSRCRRWLDPLRNRLRVWPLSGQGWSFRIQVIGVGLGFLLSGWLTITSVSYFGSHKLLGEARERIRTLQRTAAHLSAEAELLSNAFLEQIESLEIRIEQQQATIAQLLGLKTALQSKLEVRERQLASVAEERNRTSELVDGMQQAIAAAEDLLGGVAEDRWTLERRLLAAEGQLAEVSGQRDASRRVEIGLRWQLARLEDEAARLRSHREGAQIWLKDWVLGSVESLEELFVATGVDVEKLVARAGDAPELGQGGPLQVAAADDVVVLAPPPDDDPISSNIQRLATLQRIARSLPLVSPLDQFHITSPYGKRRDPFTRSWALHPGLDLGAPRKAEVLATAPGQVVFAGPSGPYGNMVEIDHGMGILTRYAHLGSLEVILGQEVEFRQPLGVIGNTGRSTSRHLHYEIRLDDRAFDPAKFLYAGRLLVGVFDVPRFADATK
jgi:murein DD-endopeptidase MepM/ murein hydrolase activator NlpD